MRRYRILNGSIGLLALLVTEAGREYYRPYIYSRHLQDFGIADTLGNSTGTVAAVFIILCLTGRNHAWDYRYISLLALGLCGYELFQGPMGGSIDPKDIVATILAGTFCLVLYRLMHRHPFTLKGSSAAARGVTERSMKRDH
ncbi:MAG TPA: hypothetical protein PK014_14190 [Thermoanaerobaculia bacterium]|nr:hypothetical protein [Thermoanaerobaculia bacterium]HUM31214.1 hypothetical protein [Thermoanaerobaculia bacterium]HXK69550.1 hypothetical protein [Thermoanaerobaculia bacterium]